MQKQRAQKCQQNFGHEVKFGSDFEVWVNSLTFLMSLQSIIPADLVFYGVLSPKAGLAACVLQATSAAESNPTANG